MGEREPGPEGIQAVGPLGGEDGGPAELPVTVAASSSRTSLLFRRVWDSPAAMTLASTLANILRQLVVLPLVLRRFDAPTVSVHLLFASVVALQGLAAAGFNQTFSRAVAFAAGGAATIDDIAAGRSNASSEGPNWTLLESVIVSMRRVYAWLALWTLLALGLGGSLILFRPISSMQGPSEGWSAWIVVVVVATAGTWGTLFPAYLEGMNHIALVRRWDLVITSCSAAMSVAILGLGGSFFAFVAGLYGFTLLGMIRNWMLCRYVEGGRFVRARGRPSPSVIRALWPATWRSGVGVASTFGLNQASGVVFAQIGRPSVVAGYLLALRLIDILSNLSRAPFYGKIPALVRLRAQGRLREQAALARRGMRQSYWIFVPGLMFAALLGPPVFRIISRDVAFPEQLMWALLGLAVLLQRYGSMHIQLYSTTNHIIWHIANSGYAVVFLSTAVLLFGRLGHYAFPVGMLAGYAGWYSWYAARHSYRALDLRFWNFERSLLGPPFVAVLAYLAFVLFW